MDRDPQTAVNVGHLFTPQVLLHTQMPRSAANRWLRRLYVAILRDALACLEGEGPPTLAGSSRDRTYRQQETWQWVMSEAEHCFAFVTICAVLDLDVEAIRRAVRQRFAPGRALQHKFPRSLRQLHARTPGQRQPPEPRSKRERSGKLEVVKGEDPQRSPDEVEQ